MSLLAPQSETGGRSRMCKQCKFSCTDAKEFYRHQLTEHGEAEGITCDNCEQNFDSDAALDKHLAEKCQETCTKRETTEHKEAHCDGQASGVEEDVMNSEIATMQFSPRQTGLGEDVVNNNDILDKSGFLENNPDYPGSHDVGHGGASTSPKSEAAVSNTTANDSGYVRGSESHENSADLEEAREGQERKHDVSDDNIELVIDEDAEQNNDPPIIENPPHYIDIKPVEEDKSPVITGGNMGNKYRFPSPAFSIINPSIFSADALKNSSAISVGRSLAKTTPVKDINSGLSNSVTPPRRCAPVREAVDPAKYVTVQEGDGVKYACSKCGNIYKWRKSLNKHWKEKHDGEVPEPRTNATLPIPRLGGNSFPRITNQQVAPRQQRTSQASHELTYPPSMSMTDPTFRSSVMASYRSKAENPFDAMRPGSLKSSPSPNSRGPVHSFYNPSHGMVMKRPYPSSSIFDDIFKQQRGLLPIMNNPVKRPSLSPPPAHSTKPPLTNIRRPDLDDPLDLTRELPDNPDGVLDLSMKSPRKQEPSVAVHTLQDEPLDFSKPVTSDRPSPVVKPMYGSWATPKQDPSFAFSKVTMSSPVKESTPKAKQCTMCTYVTRDDLDLEAHKQFHSAQDIVCAECQESFQAIDDLNQHFVLRHMQVLAKRMAQIRSENAASASEDKGGDQLYMYLTQGANKPISTCVVCGAMYQFQWALARHFEQEHGSLPNPYQLPESPENVDSPRESDQPQAVESEKVYKCSQCPFTAGSTSELTRHQIRHSLNKYHVCKVCGFTARAKEELLEHYESEHPNVHPSDIKSSTGTVMLEGGEDSDDSQDESTQIVGPDGKSIIDIGREENTAIVFPQAPEETPRSRVGRKPNTSSSVDVLLPYKCSVCEYRARWPSEITQHMKNHSDEKPFRCPRCTYKSKWKWDVVKHLKRCGGGTVKDVIDITKVSQYNIVHCRSPENLAPTQTRELSNGPPNVTVVPNREKSPYSSDYTHENDGDDVGNQTTLVCRQCPFVANNSHEMRKHLKFHSYDVQQVYCSQCPFVGNNPAELKRHLRVHSDEKPFICKTCGYSSKWKCDLKKHCRTYNHQPAVPLTYGGHGRKPQSKEGEDSEPFMSDDQNASEYDSADTEYNGETSFNQSENTGSSREKEELGELVCEECPYMTTSRSMMTAHMLIHEQSVTSPLKCKQCDFEGQDVASFLQHKLIHSPDRDAKDATSETADSEDIGGDGEGRHEQNGQSSSRRKQSKQNIMKNKSDVLLESDQEGVKSGANSTFHEAFNIDGPADYSSQSSTHSPADLSTTAKSFSCPKSPYTTNSYQNYERHVTNHEKSSDARYTCEWCPWSSDQMYMLYRHAQTAHADVLLDTEKEVFYERVKERTLYENGPKWSQSPSYPSPSASPALSPVTGKPMYSEGKKTKRRLKNCGKCAYITDNVTTLQRHMAKHGKQGKYTCTHCDYSVDKQHVVDYHIRLVHGSKSESPHQSVPSPIEADTTSNSTVELNDAASLDNMSLGEPDCVDLDNADVSNLKGEDVKIVHIGNRTVYGCAKCSYNTMKVSSVLKHSRQHGANKKYTCTKCDYSVDHVSHVRNHMKSIHGDSGAISPCQSPDVERQMNGDAAPLQTEATEPKEKRMRLDASADAPFSCSNCSFEGETITDLVAHKCSNVQDLKCEHFDYVAISSGLTKLHAKTHGVKSPVKIHSCDKCPYRTASRSQLENHKTRHGLRSKHNCPYCDYSCGNTTQQGNHVKLHFPNNDIDRDMLHLLMKGARVEGLSPKTTLQDSDLAGMYQGQIGMETDEEQYDEDVGEKPRFGLNSNNPVNGQFNDVH